MAAVNWRRWFAVAATQEGRRSAASTKDEPFCSTLASPPLTALITPDVPLPASPPFSGHTPSASSVQTSPAALER